MTTSTATFSALVSFLLSMRLVCVYGKLVPKRRIPSGSTYVRSGTDRTLNVMFWNNFSRPSTAESLVVKLTEVISKLV